MKKFFLFGLVVILGGVIANQSLAWVDPADGQNIFAPINTSSIGQTKLGGLVLNVGNATYGLIVRYGFVGIGVEKPSVMLEVGGDIKGNNLTLNSGTNSGVLNSREINNSEKIKTNELCFTKQGAAEDCRSGWPSNENEMKLEWGESSEATKLVIESGVIPIWSKVVCSEKDLFIASPRYRLNEECLCQLRQWGSPPYNYGDIYNGTVCNRYGLCNRVFGNQKTVDRSLSCAQELINSIPYLGF